MEKTIKDLDIYISDGNYSSKYPRSEEFVKDGIPFIRGNNMVDGDISDDEMYYITPKKHAILLKGHVKAGDVLITTRGNIGQVAIVPERHEDSNINAQIVLLRTNSKSLYNRYLLWALQSHRANEQYIALQTGTALKQLPVGKLEKLSIKVVDIDKQHDIVNTLDKVYEVIKERRKELLLLDDLIKARFVEMFGDVTTGNYKYKTCKLGDVANIGSSHRVFTTEFVEKGIPFYRGTEIGELANGIKPTNPYYIAEEHYNRLINDGTKPQIGDLLMPSICNKGQVWMVDTEEPFYYKDGRVLCVSADRRIFNTKYLEYFMRVKTLLEYSKLGSGSTFAEFKIFLLKDIDVLIPPIELQNEFADFVHQVDKSKVAVQKALDETQLLFDSLMQQYFG